MTDRPLRPTHTPPRAAKSAARALAEARRAAKAMQGLGAPAVAHAAKIDPAAAHPAEAAAVVGTALELRARGDDRDPFALILDAAHQAGFTDSFAKALATRLARSPEFIATGERLTNETLIAALDDKIRLFLAHVDEVVVAEMKGRDLMIAMGIALDKKRLLQGEPTEIVDTRTRKSLDELIPAVIEEAKRRGIAIPLGQLIEVNPKS